MKQRKMTKRQLLNELLVIEEKRAKIEASETRLYNRRKKLKEDHGKLANDLLVVCLKEQKKVGGDCSYVEDPIVFKGNSFDITTPSWSEKNSSVSIHKVNNVK